MKKTINFYNHQIDLFIKKRNDNPDSDINKFIERDTKQISWSSSLIPNAERGKKTKFDENSIYTCSYRPFFKQYLYYGDKFIHRRGQFSNIFAGDKTNLIINVSSSIKGVDALLTNTIADSHFNGDTQCFPLYYYEEAKQHQASLFDSMHDNQYLRRDGISNYILDTP